MAEVTCEIGGHVYRLACHDGEEDALQAAARLLDDKVSGLKQALGGAGETRLLLMAGLLLAGEQLERRAGNPPTPPDSAAADTAADTAANTAAADMLDALLQRMEKLADALETAR